MTLEVKHETSLKKATLFEGCCQRSWEETAIICSSRSRGTDTLVGRRDKSYFSTHRLCLLADGPTPTQTIAASKIRRLKAWPGPDLRKQAVRRS
ncbi:hypothetical protein FH972_025237 [Carpinus fangiana]|uniref:Uncharacterized protein n=1 Tax=Carpinus fangiana TaxID=176857 RepID=A0A5N6L0K4_9ROSI|nr:hypothetical protein FH972_025237 [Carpinus fangiana]